MNRFGPAMRRLRQARGLSLRALAARTAYDHSYLSQVERGVRPPTPPLAAICDKALGADGDLMRTYEEQAGETEMHRRTVLRTMTGMTVMGTSSMASLESLRQALGHALDADHHDDAALADEYGRAYYTTPPSRLIEQISVDLAALQQTMVTATDGRRRGTARTISHLAVLLAMALAATGQKHLTARWWSSARLAADRSGDRDAAVFVGAWEVVNGCYRGGPLAQLIDRADETIALAGNRADAAVAGVLAGRAQALALAGRRAEAEAAVRQVAQVTDRIPPDVVADAGSVFGWPEHRLHHTESFVFTHTGRVKAAMAAQDRAMALYPAAQSRLKAQVQLHRATCLVASGEIRDGLRYATEVLDGLAVDQHTANLHQVGGQVLAAVPSGERHRAEVGDLRDRLATGPRA